MAVIWDMQGNALRIILSDQLNFEQRSLFKEAVDQIADKGVKQVVIDLETLKEIDSAGIGMLLLARDQAQKNGKSLMLSRPQGEIEKIIKFAKLDQMFEISNSDES